MAQIPKIEIQVDRAAAQKAITAINTSLKTMQAELQRLNKTVGTINRRMGTFGKAGGGKKRIKETTKAVGGLNIRLFETAKTAQFAFGPLSGLAARITAFGTLVRATSLIVGVLTVAIAAFSIAVGAAIIKAVKFEKAMIEVRKNAGLTVVQFRKLGKAVSGLAKEMGIGAEKIASIADQAGRLGIKGVKNLTDFTRTVAQLTVVTNLTEGAATSLARLLSVTGEGVKGIQKLGAVITALGSNIAATESEIVDFATEIARATAIFGVSAAGAAALGAAFAATGARPEATRTALQKTFNAIIDGLIGIEKKKNVLEEVFGRPTEELTEFFKTDPEKFFAGFIQGLARLQKEGKLTVKILKELGLSNVRVSAVLQGAVANPENFRKVFDIARAQEILPTETIKQLGIFTEGAGQQIARAGQAIGDLAITIGTAFLPAVVGAAEALGGLANFINKLFASSAATEVEQSRKALSIGLGNALEAIGISASREFDLGDLANDIKKSLLLQQLPLSGLAAAIKDLTGKTEAFRRIEDFGQIDPGQILPKVLELATTFAEGGPKEQDALKAIAKVIQARDELGELAKGADLTAKSQSIVTNLLEAFAQALKAGEDRVRELTKGTKDFGDAIENARREIEKERIAKSEAATEKLRVGLLGTPQEKIRQQAKEAIKKIQESGQVEAEIAKQIGFVKEKQGINLLKQAKKELLDRIKAIKKRVDLRDRIKKIREKEIKDQLREAQKRRRLAQARLDAAVQVAQILRDPQREKEARFAQELAGLQEFFRRFPKVFGKDAKEQQKTLAEATKNLSIAVKDFNQAADAIVRGLSDAFFELFRGSKAKDIVGNFFKKLQDVAARSVADFLAEQTKSFFTEILVGIKKSLKDIFDDIAKILGNLFGKLPAGFKDLGKTLGEGFVIGTLLGGGSKAASIGGAIGAGVGKAIAGPIGKFVGAAIGAGIGGLFAKAPKGFVSIGKAFDNIFVASVKGSRKAVGAARAAGNALVEVFNKLTSGIDQLEAALDPFANILAGTEFTVKAGKKKPFRIRIGGKKRKFATIDELAVALIDEAVGRGAFADASPVLQKILSSISTGAAISDIQAAVDFAEAFVSGFGELLPPLTDFGKELKDLKKTMDEARATALSFGLSIKTIDLAEQLKLQKKQVDFNKEIRLSILDIIDPLSAELERLKETQAERLKDATEIGANLVAVEKLGLLERQKAIESFAGQTSNVLQDFLVSITASTQSKLPTQTALANAQRRFSELRIDFLAGNVGLASGLVDAAQNLLDLRRAFDASGPGFFQTQAFVEATINRALGVEGAGGDPQLAVLQDLNFDIKAGNQTLEEIRDILAGTIPAGGTTSDGGVAPLFVFGPGGGGLGGLQSSGAFIF